ncbi:DUF2267 domain-containing protein [Streptomyces sp. V4-01]|uniref:DUF2267 domain-containing protein n=1 Tax=Actinacidiphila polyblastidii TaxID=3110430 RepID=A0ABU7P3S1_9ACTN|nr:DUF2267 domain-containing protein [Streptomyces sp. V4-01]
MHAQPGQRRKPPAPSYDRMLETVRYDGAYPTRERAAQAVHTVLGALGGQLGADLRAELAARLPAEAADALTAQQPAAQSRTGWGFVQDIAGRTGVSPAVARWDTGAVLSTVAALAGPDLLTLLIGGLPSGYALLFGRAELARAA